MTIQQLIELLQKFPKDGEVKLEKRHDSDQPPYCVEFIIENGYFLIK